MIRTSFIISDRSAHWLKKAGEYMHVIAGSPFLTVSAGVSRTFGQFLQDSKKSLIKAGRKISIEQYVDSDQNCLAVDQNFQKICVNLTWDEWKIWEEVKAAIELAHSSEDQVLSFVLENYAEATDNITIYRKLTKYALPSVSKLLELEPSANTILSGRITFRTDFDFDTVKACLTNSKNLSEAALLKSTVLHRTTGTVLTYLSKVRAAELATYMYYTGYSADHWLHARVSICTHVPLRKSYLGKKHE